MRVENPVDNFPVNYVRPNHCLVDWVGVLLPLPDGHLTAQEVQALEDVFGLPHRLPIVVEHMLRRPDLHVVEGGEEGPGTTLQDIKLSFISMVS